ncbi:MAG: hypothetical protein GY754_37780 [bacterium]|nr:hypothetical protein [bacterium]
MKKNLVFIVMAGLIAGCTSTKVFYSKAPIKEKGVIAIMPFDDYKEKNNSGQIVSSLFFVRFMQNDYQVLKPESIRRVLEESKRTSSTMGMAEVRELGTRLKADYVLTGSINDYNSFASNRKMLLMFEWLQITYSVGVTAHLIDVNTGDVVWVGSACDQSYSYLQAGEEVVNTLYSTMQGD